MMALLNKLNRHFFNQMRLLPAVVVLLLARPYCSSWSWSPIEQQHRQHQSVLLQNHYHQHHPQRNHRPNGRSIVPSFIPETANRCTDQEQQQQEQEQQPLPVIPNTNRRSIMIQTVQLLSSSATILHYPLKVWADDTTTITTETETIGSSKSSSTTTAPSLLPVQISVSGEVKKLFNEGRALETQGNIAAAKRLYDKVTKIAPRFVYGWSNLGNTQTVFGELEDAEQSYNIAINLCDEINNSSFNNNDKNGLGNLQRCNDLYIILLNRGCLRLNNGMKQEALNDLRQAEVLRGRPDAIVLQNLARAYEVNGIYNQADYDYTTAISMTANEVNPFWIRSALVKFQLGDVKGGYDLLKRVIVRFPDAPEVRATYAVFLYETGDITGAQQKFLEIPDRQRLKYTNNDYVRNVISWPPSMIERLNKIIVAVGDDKRMA